MIDFQNREIGNKLLKMDNHGQTNSFLMAITLYLLIIDFLIKNRETKNKNGSKRFIGNERVNILKDKSITSSIMMEILILQMQFWGIT